MAVSVAAIATFLIIRATQENAIPTTGTIEVDSVPSGAEVLYDGTELAGETPLTIDNVPLGTRHEITFQLADYKPKVESVDLPKTTGKAKIVGFLQPITGRLVVSSKPSKADILLNGEPRGTTPRTIPDLDMKSTKTIEIRLKGYQPFKQILKWPPDGNLEINATLLK
jgi:hypothetical protein